VELIPWDVVVLVVVTVLAFWLIYLYLGSFR
jgi:hypothetical protein